MTNEEIVKCLQEGTGDRDGLLTELYQKNVGMLRKTAVRFSSFLSPEDLMQEGFIGLTVAADHYDPSHGALFLTYGLFWVRQYMRRAALENATGTPERLQAMIHFINKSASAWERVHGHPPSDRELCEYCVLKQEDLDHLRQVERSLRPASTDAPLTEDEGAATLLDVLPAGDLIGKAEDRVFNRDRAEAVWQVVADSLPAGEADCLRGHYGYNLTYEQTARALKKTPADVKKACASALRTLRKPKIRRRLERWTDSDRRAAGMHGTGAGAFQRSWTSATERAAIDGPFICRHEDEDL